MRFRFDSLTGIHAHAIAFFFAFTLALGWLLDGRYWLSAVSGVAGLIPCVLARSPSLSIIAGGLSAAIPVAALLVYWFWGGSGSIITLIPCAIVALLVTIFLAPRMAPMHAVRFLGFTDGCIEDDLPPPLRTSLLAIRAPADEASLAISAASGAVFLSDTFSSIGINRLRSVPGAVYAGLGAALVIATGGLLLWPHNEVWRIAFILSGSVVFIAPIAALAIAMILKFSATLLIALACGPEALEAPGVTKVFAEPLPRSVAALSAQATLRMVFPSSTDLDALRRNSTLRHSVWTSTLRCRNSLRSGS